MQMPALIRYQQQHYPRFHRSARNVRLHLLTVPLFQLGSLALLFSPWLGGLVAAAAGIGACMAALAAQGRGHRDEAVPPEPFTGPWNFVARMLAEQWLAFPRFALAGGWRVAFESNPSR
ncbi:terminase [Pelomonas sp. V22]|uniref:terminase n=1 Tax=Pelomonas sp. V22 TaxID=2822139 RepID=UPI0024A9B06A|nr:terminase [Pelomonas sp. V22]MDI4632751.1 terminase [Pelomonas sp. V22]